MSTLVITRGLPGSGKSTYAKKWVSEAPGRARVNRDDLREMLHGGYIGLEGEGAVTAAQEAAVRALLTSGKDVIVDDLNLRQQYARRWLTVATECGAELEVVDYTNVPIATCIQRDELRKYDVTVGRSVGESVIRKQARFLAGKPYPLPAPVNPPKSTRGQLDIEPYSVPLGKPKAILVDLDGTMALMNGRGPHEYHRVGEDLSNEAIVRLVAVLDQATENDSTLYGPDFEIVFLSGRVETCYFQTYHWLAERGFTNHRLIMRPPLPDGVQQPKDSVVKLALFNEHIRDHYDVQFVLDDRDQVVEMWRALGLTCLQVAPGAF